MAVDSQRNGLARVRVEWILGLLVIVTVGVILQPYRAQQGSRYALTAALVERGTLVLDDYEQVLHLDRAVRDGHIYSDKAPGQPVLAVPFFAIGKAAGVEDATILRIDRNLGLWWVSFWSATVPAALLVVMMYRRVRTVSDVGAVPAALAVFFGTLLLPFSALLFGHVLTAVLLFGAFLLLVGRGSAPRLWAAGLLAGMAVTVEYSAVLGLVPLALYALWRHRRQTFVFILGGLIPAVGLAVYNQIAFGDPFTLSYQFSAYHEVTDTARPVTDMLRTGSLGNLPRLLFEGRGLLAATPIVVIAVAGAMARLRRGIQVDAAMALAMFGLFVLLPLFWGNPWGGDSPGARYLTPALPFLAVPLVWAWQRWRLLTFAAVAVSVVTMMVATFTDPMIGREAIGGIGIWVKKLFEGGAAETLWTMSMGAPGWLVHGLTVAAVVWLLVGRLGSKPVSSSPSEVVRT